MRTTLRELLARRRLTLAPAVFDALTGLFARESGFEALYLGGASIGYLKGVSEANLTVHDLCAIGIDVMAATKLPLIMDGGCGWGDPMHVRRVVTLTQAHGFDAIELEDQVAPKRAHHHIGVEHLVPCEVMATKVQEAVRARTDDNFFIIARTNAAHTHGIDEAVRRCIAYRAAGADVLFPLAHGAESLRALGEGLRGRLGDTPLMQMVFPDGSFAQPGLPPEELCDLGYRLLVDAVTPFVHLHRALRAVYESLASSEPDARLASEELDAVHRVLNLELLLDIERRTVEKAGG